jgi:hypothetical protein
VGSSRSEGLGVMESWTGSEGPIVVDSLAVNWPVSASQRVSSEELPSRDQESLCSQCERGCVGARVAGKTLLLEPYQMGTYITYPYLEYHIYRVR